MSHETILRDLDGYLEGSLDPAAMNAVRTHLEGCAACRDEAAALQDLVRAARALPREVAPLRDLWPGIEAAARPANRTASPRRAPPRRAEMSRPGAFRLAFAAAAALAVLWLGTRLTPSRPGAPEQAARDRVPLESTRPGKTEDGVPQIFVIDQEARPQAAGWARMIWALEEQNLGAGKVLLATLSQGTDPEAIRRAGEVIPGLEALDGAIDETTAALRQDPENPHLAKALAQHYEQKLELLRLAVRIAHGRLT